jgi:hypothetical protein
MKSTYGLLGYNAVYYREIPTFQRSISPASSGSKSKPNNKPCKTGSVCRLLLAGPLLTLLFDPEDAGDMFLRNFWPFFRTTFQKTVLSISHLCMNPKSNLIQSFKKNCFSLLYDLGFRHRMIVQFKLPSLMVYDRCYSSNYSEYMHISFEETFYPVFLYIRFLDVNV